MCLLALLWGSVPGVPVVVAANREERFDRSATAPRIRPEPPRAMCGTDAAAGGTWLGVGEHGVLVAVTNRRRATVPPRPRSRGLLCLDLLAERSADAAARRAFAEVGTGRYAGCNVLCVDASRGLVVQAGDRHAVLEVTRGLHLISNGDLDDAADERLSAAKGIFEAYALDTLDAAVDAARAACADARVVVDRGDRGTVSSQIVAVANDASASLFLHAPGRPDRTEYEDLSEELRELLARPARKTAPARARDPSRPKGD